MGKLLSLFTCIICVVAGYLIFMNAESIYVHTLTPEWLLNVVGWGMMLLGLSTGWKVITSKSKGKTENVEHVVRDPGFDRNPQLSVPVVSGVSDDYPLYIVNSYNEISELSRGQPVLLVTHKWSNVEKDLQNFKNTELANIAAVIKETPLALANINCVTDLTKFLQQKTETLGGWYIIKDGVIVNYKTSKFGLYAYDYNFALKYWNEIWPG